ncbi:hypothetical protein BDZ91DRAFT_130505 [Kalaharituber pfeilii]|nr:hypothetical protein BDZ91DRAFT_130505 [Kalaharituber pfeilii]
MILRTCFLCVLCRRPGPVQYFISFDRFSALYSLLNSEDLADIPETSIAFSFRRQCFEPGHGQADHGQSRVSRWTVLFRKLINDVSTFI